MYRKKFLGIFFIFLSLIIVILFSYFKFFGNNKSKIAHIENKEEVYNSNLIKDVEYSTKDKNNNEYFIRADEGEIDFSNPNIIFLKKVYAFIKLIDSREITIVSDFGKYNSENYDTIFSKNVKINYLDNKIAGEYLDFSLERNLMIISKEVSYSNLDNIMKADVIEINIKSKDTKIFMQDQKEKVILKSKN